MTKADLANIGVLLFTPGTLIPVPLDFDKPVRLWRAINETPAEPVAAGVKVIQTVEGKTFPAWEFNDVDVSAARDPRNKVFFFVTVEDLGTNSNVWAHGPTHARSSPDRTYLRDRLSPLERVRWCNPQMANRPTLMSDIMCPRLPTAS